jgi:hypothetical protein
MIPLCHYVAKIATKPYHIGKIYPTGVNFDEDGVDKIGQGGVFWFASE